MLASPQYIEKMMQAADKVPSPIDPRLATREQRRRWPALAAGFYVLMVLEQLSHDKNTLICKACESCGLPTGSWCDACEAPLCSGCEDEFSCLACE